MGTVPELRSAGPDTVGGQLVDSGLSPEHLPGFFPPEADSRSVSSDTIPGAIRVANIKNLMPDRLGHQDLRLET